MPLFMAIAAQGQSASHHVYGVSNPDAIKPSEVSVSINPTNSDHIVAVSLQALRPGSPVKISDFSYTSIDGGRTWTTTPVQNPERRVHGDDAITAGRDGVFYHTYISFDGIRISQPERAFSGIYIRTSRDGLEWSEPVAIVDHVNTAIPFEDKPWVAVDDAENSPNRGNVSVAWTRFDVDGSSDPEHKSHIWFARSRDGVTLARSVDGGKTFVNHRVDQAPFPSADEVFYGDYISVAARGGRVVALYPAFSDDAARLTLQAAVFRFKAGTQETAGD
jgi:hypothetical protein